MKKISELAILGSYPPPYGGVTIHTRRLCSLLEQRNVPYVIYNAASEAENGEQVHSVYRIRHFWMIWYAFFGQEPVIYIMSPRLMSWLLGAFLTSVRRKKVILRIQNSRLVDWCRKTTLRKNLAGFALRRISEIVSVNREIREQLIALGVRPEKVHVFPGFLPPVEKDLCDKAVIPDILRFLENHDPVISANGKISFYRGEDLYGLDHLVELAIRLKPEYPRLGIVFCFSDFSEDDQGYLDKLLSKAAGNDVQDNLFFHKEGGPFLPILKNSDLFVRPTNTDGDANSVREALYLGIPTVASDAVGRPGGVVQFESRNLIHFTEKVRLVLSQRKDQKNRAGAINPETETAISEYVKLLTTASQPNNSTGEMLWKK